MDNKLKKLEDLKQNNNTIYIYNLEQAYFYIENGLRPIFVDKHNKTNKIFYIFDKRATNSTYSKWLEIRNKIKNAI